MGALAVLGVNLQIPPCYAYDRIAIRLKHCGIRLEYCAIRY